MWRMMSVLLLASCGGASTSAATTGTTTETASATTVEVDEAAPVEEPSTPSGALVWRTVDHFGEGERYVILGSAGETPDGEGTAIEGAELDMFVHETGGDVPALTLVGYGGTCTATSARRVTIDRRFDPDDPEDPYRAAFDAVAVASECEPVLAVEGAHPDAHLVNLEIPDVPFGQPIVASGEGWTVRLEYAPSEDGICPGSPLSVQVKRGDEPLLRRNSYLVVSYVRVVTIGARAWLLLGALDTAHLIELGVDGEETFSWPSGVDLAETCL